MKKYIVSILVASMFLIGAPFVVKLVSAQDLSLRDFINLLVAIGVITPDKMPAVNAFLANLDNNHGTTNPQTPANQNSINQRNAERRSNVLTILNGIYQYAIDNSKTLAGNITLPMLGLTTSNTCDSNGTSASSLAPYLVDKYLPSIPTDPNRDAIATMVLNYVQKAVNAVKFGDGKLYVPGYMTKEDFLRIVANPESLVQTGGNASEPAYLSLEEGQRGRNADGSEHKGFIVIDVIAREVVDIVDRNGKSSLNENVLKETYDGLWGGYKINFRNPKGENFEIDTVDGVRGMNIPVKILLRDGVYSVLHDGRPLAIKKIIKFTVIA